MVQNFQIQTMDRYHAKINALLLSLQSLRVGFFCPCPRSCDRCCTTSAPAWRYMMQLSASDHTGVHWMTAFNDGGEMLLGHKTQDLREIREQSEEEYDRILSVRVMCCLSLCHMLQRCSGVHTLLNLHISRV